MHEAERVEGEVAGGGSQFNAGTEQLRVGINFNNKEQ